MKTKIYQVSRISDDFFQIKNDNDLHFVLGISYGIYLKFLINNQQFVDKNNMFKIDNFIIDDEYLILNEQEIDYLYSFISSVCSVFLESDGVDFSNKQIIRYFKISQQFVKSISKATEKVNQIK